MKHVIATLVLVAAGLAAIPAVAAAQGATVRLNEVQSSNQTTLTDASGAHPDWIELFNEAGTAVDLAGWGLSDDPAAPFAWQFPAGTWLDAGSFLVVFASGTGAGAGDELHTNFRLAADGEFLGLYRPDGTLHSSFNPIPAMAADASWGVGSDGVLNLFDPATPGLANGSGSLGVLADVVLHPARGLYTTPVSVSISASPGDTIYYTVDGTLPSPTTGAVYTRPVTISSTTVLRSVAVRAGWTSPQPVTSTYLFADDVASQPRMDAALAPAHASEIAASMLALPTISLTSTDENNDPSFTWSETEDAAVAVEMIHPDGTPGFHIDAGAHEVGAATVALPKDSLRLVFGAEWGDSELNYPVFAGTTAAVPATTKFKRLTLRAGAQDGFFWDYPAGGPHRSYLRAAWHDQTMLDLGHPGIRSRFVNVFLNGEYWGLYQLREHPDDHFMASYFGGDNDDYIAVNGGVVRSGSGTSWNALVAAAGSWEQFSQIVDAVNYVDYMLVSEYGGNVFDLRANKNWRGAGPATAGAGGVGYQFFHSDTDGSLVSTTNALGDPDGRSVFTGPADSWELLQTEAHPAFLALVEERAELLLLDGGVLTPDAATQRWDAFAPQIADATHAEYVRWSTPLPQAHWETSMTWFRDVLFPERTANTIAILQTKGLLSANPGSGLEAPTFSLDGGAVPYGSQVTIDTSGQPGSVWYTIDGSDPRAFDGAVAAGAAAYDAAITIGSSVTLHARILDGAEWSPPLAVTYSLSAPAGPVRILVNEFNAVSSSSYLGGGAVADTSLGSDQTFGRVAGNGGDWFELVVLEDGLDLRGWTFEIWNGSVGVSTRDAALTLTNAAELSALRAGTILTISESIADDVSFNALAGDWHINLQSNASDQGEYFTDASQTNFAINSDGTEIVIIDANGLPAALATGEGAAPGVEVSKSEVFKLETAPDASITPSSPFYLDGTSSTWGLPNSSASGASTQDFGALRFIYGDVNCSGTVTISDAVLIAQATVGLRSDSTRCPIGNAGTQIHLTAADANGSGTVTVTDAILVVQCTAQLTNVLCPEV